MSARKLADLRGGTEKHTRVHVCSCHCFVILWIPNANRILKYLIRRFRLGGRVEYSAIGSALLKATLEQLCPSHQKVYPRSKRGVFSRFRVHAYP